MDNFFIYRFHRIIFLFLIYWGIHQKLVNQDYTLEISWQRHIGNLILGYIIFLFIKTVTIYPIKYKSLILIFIIVSLCAMPRSLKHFLPHQMLMQDNFYLKNVEMRKKLKNYL